MLRSMYSGVSGMKAHQARMDVIGNNIANVNTYGFKASRMSFRDVYYQTISGASGGSLTRGGVNPSQIGYGVQIGNIDVLQTRSTFQMTDNGMDLAIAGEGFFQVQDSQGNIFYTRVGMLNIDAAGNLVDSNGNFVLGVSENPLGKAAASNKIQINVPSVSAASAKAVEKINNIEYTITASNSTADGNVTFNFVSDTGLPGGQKAKAEITNAGITIRLNATERFSDMSALSAAINEAITEANGGKAHPAGSFTISANPSDIFPVKDDTAVPPILGGLTGAEIVSKDFSIVTGKLEGIPEKGIFGGMNFKSASSNFSAAGEITFEDAIYCAADPDATPPVLEGWQIKASTADGKEYIGYVTVDMKTANSVLLKDSTTGEYIEMTHPGIDKMNAESGVTPVVAGTTIGLPATMGTVTAVPSKPSDALGLSSKSIMLTGGTVGGSQTVADLTSIAIGADGAIEAFHHIHGRLQLGRLDLVTFENPQGLEQVGNTYFAATANSGEANACAPGSSGAGSLASGSLEMSNVDLSKEFSDMITTQRGFQASSRLITVSDEMLEVLVNLKR